MKYTGFLIAIFIALLLVSPQVSAAPNEQAEIIPPKLIYLPAIVFSEIINAEYAGKQVTVKLRVSLSDSGTVNADALQIVDSSGNDDVDQAVIGAVKGAIFSPAYQEGNAISIVLLLPLKVEVPENPPEKKQK